MVLLQTRKAPINKFLLPPPPRRPGAPPPPRKDPLGPKFPQLGLNLRPSSVRLGAHQDGGLGTLLTGERPIGGGDGRLDRRQLDQELPSGAHRDDSSGSSSPR